eukprot:SAG25_NODE_2621_length_1485_cov_2.831169_2_plen_183_part_00
MAEKDISASSVGLPPLSERGAGATGQVLHLDELDEMVAAQTASGTAVAAGGAPPPNSPATDRSPSYTPAEAAARGDGDGRPDDGATAPVSRAGAKLAVAGGGSGLKKSVTLKNVALVAQSSPQSIKSRSISGMMSKHPSMHSLASLTKAVRTVSLSDGGVSIAPPTLPHRPSDLHAGMAAAA